MIKKYPKNRPQQAIAISVICLAICACGGGGSGKAGDKNPLTPVISGGAQCESGVPLNELSTGYDELYNSESDPNPPISISFDSSDFSSKCAEKISASEILPWIRIENDSPNFDSTRLRFELVGPGGRNATVWARYPISDPTAQSFSGGFSYHPYLGDDLDCRVEYEGSYCPQKATTKGTPTLRAFANGTVDCTLRLSGGETHLCHGTLTVDDATLYAGFYGE